MIPGNIVIPARPNQEYLVNLVRAQYQIWREEKDAREEKWVPVNIRFEHDPNWRNRLISIQCAHDGNILFWQVAKVVYVAAAAAPYILQMIQ